MTSAFFVGMHMLAGKEFKDDVFEGPYGNTIYVPIPTVVTNINFDTVYNAYKDYPDYYSVDGHLTEAQAASYFKEAEYSAGPDEVPRMPIAVQAGMRWRLYWN